MLPCLLCKTPMAPVFRKNDTDVLGCDTCRYRRAAIEPTDGFTEQHFDDDYFFGGKDGYADYCRDRDLMEHRGRWYAELAKKKGIASGTMLDIGAAAGFLMHGWNQRGWQVEGVEPNRSLVRFGRKELNLTIHHGTLESITADRKYDVVCMIQVLAHLTDPISAFRQAARMTRLGAYWLIETWNYRSLAARLFGQAWHQYSPPRTLHWFTPHSLTALASRCGMTLIDRGRPDKSISGEHAKSLLRHAVQGNRFLQLACLPAVIVPDRIRIPYLADDVSWYLFRKDTD